MPRFLARLLGQPRTAFKPKPGPTQRRHDRDRIRARMIEMRQAMGLPID